MTGPGQPEGKTLDNSRVDYVSWDKEVGEGGWITGRPVGIIHSTFQGNPTELLKLADASGEPFLVPLTSGLREQLTRHGKVVKGKIIHVQWVETEGRFKRFQLSVPDDQGRQWTRVTSALVGEPQDGFPADQVEGEDDLPF